MLKAVQADQATYEFEGNELYVRARILSSRLFKAISPGNKIDHIFVRDGSAVLSHRIEDPRVHGRFVSDHLPIVAEIEIADGE